MAGQNGMLTKNKKGGENCVQHNEQKTIATQESMELLATLHSSE